MDWIYKRIYSEKADLTVSSFEMTPNSGKTRPRCEECDVEFGVISKLETVKSGFSE